MLKKVLIPASVTLSLLVIALTATGAEKADVSQALALNKEGERLLEQGKYADAIAVFTKMLDQCGTDDYCVGVAKFYLGRSYVDAAQYGAAAKWLDEAEAVFHKLNKKNERAMVTLNRGKASAGQGDYQNALKHFKAAEAVFVESKNRKELFPLYNSISVVQSYLCRYDEALDYLEKAEKLIGDSSDARLWALVHNNTGLVLAKRQECKDALDQYEKAFKQYESYGDIKGMSVVLNNMGQVFESRSEFPKAMKKHQEALELAQKIQDPWCESLAWNNLGCVELKRGNYKGAQEAYQKALSIRKSLGMKHFAAETLNNLGLVWLAYADYPQALQCFVEAGDTCRTVGSPSGEAWAKHNQAFLHKDQGKFKEAQAASEAAVKIARQIEDRRLEATAILRLGNLYEYQGMFDRALDEYVRAADVQKEISDWNFRANTLMDIANIMTRQGEATDAEEVYQEALKLKRRIGAPPGEILCKFALFHMEKNKLAKTQESPEQGAYKADPKDLSKAKDLIETAEKEITSEQKIDSMLLTYVKGRFLLDQDPQKAIGQFAALKTQAEASGVRRFSFLASVGLGLAHESLKNWEEAARAFQQAVDYAEYIRNTLDPHERLSFLDGEEILGMKHVVPYKGLSRVLMKRGDSDQSLMWAEYTKARAFSESLARRWEEASFNMPKEVLDKDFDLETKLSGLIRAVEKAYEQGATDAVHSLQQDIEKFSAERKRHVDELRQKFPLYAATKYPQPTPLNRAALKESELVLEYDVTDSGVLIFLTRGNHLTKAIFKPVPGFQVDELVRRFREPLEIVSGKDDPADKLKSFDFEAGRKLASLLVEDVLAELPEQTPVTIVPDGSLGMLPFEMLMLSSEGQVTEEGEFPTVTAAVFFGDRNPISYSQSITALTLARTLGRKEKPSDRLLVMADPVFEQRDARALHARPIMMAEADKQFSIAIMNALEETSGGFKFNRLPLTGEMASHLNEIFEQNSDVYTGLKASKKNFLKDVGLRLEGYGNLVLGTHGFFSKDNPHFREPILVLTLVPVGTDGFLRMTEVTGLKLNCDLVALVACQTGLGRHISGEGTIGMGRAFQYAGARSVLMSLWSVPEISSVKLVENFFKYTKAGKNKLEALQMARADIRQEGFNHPFFWASFILVGEIE